jgi:TonB family protein
MHSADRRKKRVPTGTLWLAAVGTALLVHGTVLGAADGLGFSLIAEGFAATSDKKKDVEIVDLETSCSGDVLLATAARAATCLSPWQSDQPQCAEDLQMTFWMDLSACLGRGQTIAPVAMTTVQPREIEKLVAIDPEPLLEELREQDKPPPPPPQPQLQPNTPPPPPPPAPPPPKRPKQVVETAKPNTEQEPDNARFLAEHNTKVEKQKVARGTPKEPMVAKSKPEELKAVEKPKDEPSIAKKPELDNPGKNPNAPPVPGTLVMRKPGAPAPNEVPQDAKTRGERGEKQPIVANGGIPRRGDGAIEQQRRDPGQQTKGQGGAGGGAPQVPNLKPSREQLERIVGGGNVDHLEEVENGDETALNAKRWVYASFFNRMKRQVAQNWDPQTVWRRSDPSGQKHGFKTRVTEVRVSLSSRGELSKIVVTSGSGVQELDDEAVRSFHAAAPFPNPPDGLVGKDGNITFAFSFYFEIGAPRTSWRVIRQ